MQQAIENLRTELSAHGARFTNDGAIVFASGQAVAFRFPDGAEPNDPAVSQAARVVRAVAEMHGAIKAIEEDTRFSAEHKAKLVAEARETGGKAVAIELAAATALVEKFDRADAQEAVPPALVAADHNGGLIDAEIRAYVRSLDNAGHAQLAQELLDGRAPRVLDALLRSPIPLPPAIARVVGPAWADAISRADPKSARLRALAKATNEALRTTATQAAGALSTAKPQLHAA